MSGEGMVQQATKHSSLPLALKIVHSHPPMQLKTKKKQTFAQT